MKSFVQLFIVAVLLCSSAVFAGGDKAEKSAPKEAAAAKADCGCDATKKLGSRAKAFRAKAKERRHAFASKFKSHFRRCG